MQKGADELFAEKLVEATTQMHREAVVEQMKKPRRKRFSCQNGGCDKPYLTHQESASGFCPECEEWVGSELHRQLTEQALQPRRGRRVPATAKPRLASPILRCSECDAPSGEVTLVKAAGGYHCKTSCARQRAVAMVKVLERARGLRR